MEASPPEPRSVSSGVSVGRRRVGYRARAWLAALTRYDPLNASVYLVSLGSASGSSRAVVRSSRATPVHRQMCWSVKPHSVVKVSRVARRRSSSSISKPYVSCAVRIDRRALSSGDSGGLSDVSPVKLGEPLVIKLAIFSGAIFVTTCRTYSEMCPSAISHLTSAATSSPCPVINPFFPTSVDWGRPMDYWPPPASLIQY